MQDDVDVDQNLQISDDYKEVDSVDLDEIDLFFDSHCSRL